MAEEAEKGDELSTELILQMARCLGVGITTVCHVIDPTIVLLGGAMTFGRHETEIGRRFLQTVRDEFREIERFRYWARRSRLTMPRLEAMQAL